MAPPPDAAPSAQLQIPVHLRPSTGFRPPSDPATPIIMIGPGTGVAPFRGFLQQRRAEAAGGAGLGESWLFFGNRRSDWDYLYEDDLRSFVDDGTLSHLVTAWSRESEKKVRASVVPPFISHRVNWGAKETVLISDGQTHGHCRG